MSNHTGNAMSNQIRNRTKYCANHTLPSYRPGWKGVWDHFVAVLFKRHCKTIISTHRLAFVVISNCLITGVDTWITDITLTQETPPVPAHKILNKRGE